MNYYRGPFQWITKDSFPYWGVPFPAVCLDLRGNADQLAKGGTPSLGIFCTEAEPQAVGSNYDLLGTGNWHDIKPNQKVSDSLPKPAKYKLQGDDLIGMIFDLMTNAADPTGDSFAKPLMPTTDGRLELLCGQSFHYGFAFGRDPLTPKVVSVLQSDIQSIFQDIQAGKAAPDMHRKALGFLCLKFGLSGNDWQQLVPPALLAHIQSPLAPATSVTDDFNRADSTTVGNDSAGNAWSEVVADWKISSNKLVMNGGQGLDAIIRDGTDLSGSDNYASCDIVQGSDYTGMAARMSGSANTRYSSMHNAAGTWQTWKIVTGTFTSLTSGSFTAAQGVSYNGKLTANGSSISAVFNSNTLTVTDTAISTGLRGGCCCWASPPDHSWDNYAGSDLAPSGSNYTQLERGTRGLLRGMYTHY